VGGCPGGDGEGLGELVAMGGGWRVGGPIRPHRPPFLLPYCKNRTELN